MKKYKTLDEFFKDQDSEKLEQIMLIREIILGVSPELVETLKWNAPNYVLNGEDRITFNLMNRENKVKVIFHMGATIKEDKKGAPILQDDSGFIEWSSNIRGMVTFDSVEDVKEKEKRFRELVKSWLAIK